MKHCGVTLERPAGRREKAACYITFLCYPARVAPVAEDDCARVVHPAAGPGAAG